METVRNDPAKLAASSGGQPVGARSHQLRLPVGVTNQVGPRRTLRGSRRLSRLRPSRDRVVPGTEHPRPLLHRLPRRHRCPAIKRSDGLRWLDRGLHEWTMANRRSSQLRAPTGTDTYGPGPGRQRRCDHHDVRPQRAPRLPGSSRRSRSTTCRSRARAPVLVLHCSRTARFTTGSSANRPACPATRSIFARRSGSEPRHPFDQAIRGRADVGLLVKEHAAVPQPRGRAPSMGFDPEYRKHTSRSAGATGRPRHTLSPAETRRAGEIRTPDLLTPSQAR